MPALSLGAHSPPLLPSLPTPVSMSVTDQSQGWDTGPLTILRPQSEWSASSGGGEHSPTSISFRV